MKNKIIITLILSLILIPSLTFAEIDPDFDPNRILEDQDILNYDSMDIPAIQKFLQNKHSYLANYFAPDVHGITRTASEIIYNATHNNYDCEGVILSDYPTEAEKKQKCKIITTVNPKLILVLLQKEASLIEDPHPNQKHLDWATGYGCPDNWSCNPYYKGFGKQVNSAALQFLAYMKEPYNYNYKPNHTYTFNNSYGTISNQKIIVTPKNQATAALYNYTPHVFNGNYNVYKLWKKYFGDSEPQKENIQNIILKYPDGSILKAKDNPTVWLIEDGKKRPFLNWASFVSRYRPEQIISIEAKDLEGYPKGKAIRFPNYALIKTETGNIYLIVDGKKRPFANMLTFKQIGYNPEELENATETDLSSYKLGNTITVISSHISGDLIKDPKTGGVYYVENDTKAPIIDPVFLTTKFKGKPILNDINNELEKYKKIEPVKFDNGELLKKENWPTIFLISNGKKRPFADINIFKKLGYNINNIITVKPQTLALYDNGDPIK